MSNKIHVFSRYIIYRVLYIVSPNITLEIIFIKEFEHNEERSIYFQFICDFKQDRAFENLEQKHEQSMLDKLFSLLTILQCNRDQKHVRISN